MLCKFVLLFQMREVVQFGRILYNIRCTLNISFNEFCGQCLEFVFFFSINIFHQFNGVDKKSIFTCVLELGGFITTMFDFTCCCIFMPCLTITNFCGLFTVCDVDPVESWRCGTTVVGFGVLLKHKKHNH